MQSQRNSTTNIAQTFTANSVSTNTTTVSSKSQIENRVPQLNKIGRHITRLPQFSETEEFLKCITNCTVQDLDSPEDDTRLNNGFASLFSSVMPTNPSETLEKYDEDSGIKYDIILENQRGATLFGMPVYGTDPVLTPFDPPKYETLAGLSVSNLNHYPLPGKSWKWCWNTWHILMIKDVDEEGWIYSRIRFGSHHWKGVGKFGNFVRRRIWIRKREKQASEEQPFNANFPSSIIVNVESRDKKKKKKKKPKKLKDEVTPIPTLEIETAVAAGSDVRTSLGNSAEYVPVSSERVEDAYTSHTYETIHKVNNLIRDLNEQNIDRMKTKKLIQFFENCSITDLRSIMQEFENYSSDIEMNKQNIHLSPKSQLETTEGSWLSGMLATLQFNDSKKNFLNQLNSLINSDDINNDTESNNLLNSILEKCDYLLSDSFYDFEKRK